MTVGARYYTDPACPRSWSAEPAVRKLMVEFGDNVSWTYVMGGLARDYTNTPEARHRPGLAPEPLELDRVVLHRVMQNLDGDPALQRLVEGAVDRRHAARADSLFEPVAAA